MTRRVRFSPLLAAGVFAAGLCAGRARAADVPFLAEPVQFPGGNSAAALVPADLDRDGDLDVVQVEENGDRVGWFENADGAGTWTFRTISTALDGPRAVAVADLDRDGDPDLAVVSLGDQKVSWFESAGDGSGWTLRTVSTSSPAGRSLSAGDIDGDGDQDLIYASGPPDTGVPYFRWFENAGGGAAWVPHDINASSTVPNTALLADIDGDGDQDIVSARGWHENLTGLGTTWASHDLPLESFSQHAVDFDRDGDLDLAFAMGSVGFFGFFENLDGVGVNWMIRFSAPGHDSISSVFAGDLDADGDVDLAFGEGFVQTFRLAWLENTGGVPSTWTERTVSTLAAPRSATMADLDGDGDLDLMGTNATAGLAWYRNATVHQDACFVPRTIGSVSGARAVVPADVDGDGDLDVVSTASVSNTVHWHDNAAGDASAWVTRTVGGAFPGAAAAAAGDVDGDGDTDVVALGAPITAGTLAWFENVLGVGNVWTRRTVSTAFNAGTYVGLLDLSGDGDLDLLGAGYYTSPTRWFENAAGSGASWTAGTLPNGLQTAVATGDFDRDGDLDVASTESFFGNGASWTENVSGDGASWSPHAIDTAVGTTYAMAAADLDGDGDLDVLKPGASALDGTALWFENVGGSAASWAPHPIPGTRPAIAAVGDLDRDGDLDVIARGSASTLRQWENVDGSGLVWSEHPVADLVGPVGQLAVADLDRDGDLDALSATPSVNAVDWYENRGGQARVAVVDQAPATAGNGDLVSMLRATVTHLGRAGDGPIELASLGLLFEEAPGDPLTSAEANALLESLQVYRDANGSGVFEPATDVQVTSVPTLVLTNGIATVAFADGDANAQVAVGSPRAYFVVAEIALTASGQVPNQFRVTLLQTGASRSVVEDRTFDIPLRLACPTDVSSTIRQVVPVELSGFSVE